MTITSKAEWTALAVHTIHLPSGAIVKAIIPDLSLLMAADAVPDELQGIAMEELMGSIVAIRIAEGVEGEKPKVELDRGKIAQLAELHYWLVAEMLLEPKLTVEELKNPETRPPNPDLEMLTSIAVRELDEDAAGNTIGVMPLSKVARFRKEHGCTEGCPHCKAIQDAFSTNRPSPV